ncbi:hypothetical protein CC86DRAFT_442924 [Ophiobolus disseminans]|uniref:Bromodomain associated domain-containing protein n=1 Tax=Ophiobolus disseminans TaxID=1469910 RepID=A0A6A7AEF0_9PLEO|nr:hypothetical protein CC86DRAFT_442924 [Ophiobolus disseminans]
MSSDELFRNLLRPAVLHILRASGFHLGKPSAVDTVVDITVRYISLLAERTAYNAYSNHNDSTPTITDIRMAMQDCGLLVPTMTAGEEEWKQILRKPLDFYTEGSGARRLEEQRRDVEDTADVKEFIDWVKGDQNKEIRRIAGTLKPLPTGPADLDELEMEDYLNSLMKKHSKTGVESRFQGTVLGVPAEPKTVKIEGGGAESIEEWCRRTREKAADAAASKHGSSRATSLHGTREPSEDVVMENV